jgi:ABC-type iron transport system FetAB ATPase subunit
MISRLSLSNFKSVGHQVYDLGDFDLLVGGNNSGKSTVLQALAIWQYCLDEFRRSSRRGRTGIQIVLPNFTALPVPEFNLLWKEKTDRHWPNVDGQKKQEYILIHIGLDWRTQDGKTDGFGVDLRYHSPQSIYAIPSSGWADFRVKEQGGTLPLIAYVPPFSGLEPAEKWLDQSPIRQQVGKGQPGSVLRNLLLRVWPSDSHESDGRPAKPGPPPDDWRELADAVMRWFSVEIKRPQYDSAKDVNITVEYQQGGKAYDIIAGGSGFHQTLTLLAFLYGYRPTTILLDEPDAHLHVKLQRQILDYFQLQARKRNTQFVIATHAEELVRGVAPSQIVSLLRQEPSRVQYTPDVLRAMSDVSNEEVTHLSTDPYIMYVEGESDERILRAWAPKVHAEAAIGRVRFHRMHGGSKSSMKAAADAHFRAICQIVPTAKRLMLFDYDSSETAFHPEADNTALAEWRRKNIENYMLVPDAWRRASLRALHSTPADLLATPVLNSIDSWFQSENLTLPVGRSWQDVSANVFRVVDGKQMLFENDDSLFHQLRRHDPAVVLPREDVARSMETSELHADVLAVMAKLVALVGGPTTRSDEEEPGDTG